MRFRSFLSIFLAVALGGLVARAPIPVVHGETGSFSVLDAAKGGTGNSSYTAGDLLVATGATTLTKLAKGSDGTFLGVSSGTVGYYTPAGGSSLTLFYGDGSSGSATMDGSTVCYGLTPSGNVYTATANIYATSLTINSGVTLNMANYRLFCSVALTNNGTIHCNGGAASGSTGGSAVAAGFFAAGPAGVNGLTTVSSSQPGSSAAATGGAFGGGGGGGRSDGTQQAAGSAATPSVTFLWAIRTGQAFGGSAANPTTLFSNSAVNNNQAAGRGSGDGTNAGGGSGSGGGSLAIQAKTITTGASGVYSANGGNGGNGAGGTAGGGGGGAGGAVGLWANSYSGTALVAGTNVTATHGNGGNGSTTAGAGTNGVDGNVYIITLQ